MQVGACIVDEHNKIVGIGYNSLPTDCDDDAFPWNKRGDDSLDTNLPRTVSTVMRVMSHPRVPIRTVVPRRTVRRIEP